MRFNRILKGPTGRRMARVPMQWRTICYTAGSTGYLVLTVTHSMRSSRMVRVQRVRCTTPQHEPSPTLIANKEFTSSDSQYSSSIQASNPASRSSPEESENEFVTRDIFSAPITIAITGIIDATCATSRASHLRTSMPRPTFRLSPQSTLFSLHVLQDPTYLIQEVRIYNQNPRH